MFLEHPLAQSSEPICKEIKKVLVLTYISSQTQEID